MKNIVKGIIYTIVGIVIGSLTVNYFNSKTIRSRDEKLNKFRSYYNILNQWILLKQEGKDLTEYLVKNGYKSIAIYGMGEIGSRLYTELKNSNVTVLYAIDKNASSSFTDLEVMDIEAKLPKVDAIIVTTVFAYDDICNQLQLKIECPILSLEDIMYEI